MCFKCWGWEKVKCALATAPLTGVLSNPQLFLHLENPAEVQALKMHQMFKCLIYIVCICTVGYRLNRVKTILSCWRTIQPVLCTLAHIWAERQQLQPKLSQSFTVMFCVKLKHLQKLLWVWDCDYFAPAAHCWELKKNTWHIPVHLTVGLKTRRRDRRHHTTSALSQSWRSRKSFIQAVGGKIICRAATSGFIKLGQPLLIYI